MSSLAGMKSRMCQPRTRARFVCEVVVKSVLHVFTRVVYRLALRFAIVNGLTFIRFLPGYCLDRKQVLLRSIRR
jgi:hypothetical protein